MLLSAVLAQLQSTPCISCEAGQDKKSEVQVRKVYAVVSTDVEGRGGLVSKGEKTGEWYMRKLGLGEAGRLSGVREKFGER